MVAFVGRRLLFLPMLWLGVTFLVFLMLAPLGPYQRLALYVPMDPALSAPHQSPEELRRLVETYGLDDPFLVQYGRWLGKVAHADLGWSTTAHDPVSKALLDRLPATLELALFTIGPMLLLAVWSGIAAATRQNRWSDHLMRFGSVLGISMPEFVLAIGLLIVFYGATAWFPPGRLSLWAEEVVRSPAFTRYSGLNTLDGLLNGRPDVAADALRHLVLPVAALVAGSWAGMMRVTRGAMLDALGQDYIAAARAKGLPEKLVVRRHALRNAMIPITTSTVGAFVGLLGGVVFIEKVFHYPGVGEWAVNATTALDVPAILGIALFAGVLIVFGNLAVDLLYAVVDPRVRYQ